VLDVVADRNIPDAVEDAMVRREGPHPPRGVRHADTGLAKHRACPRVPAVGPAGQADAGPLEVCGVERRAVAAHEDAPVAEPPHEEERQGYQAVVAIGAGTHIPG
jgi:hypothetical protein